MSVTNSQMTQQYSADDTIKKVSLDEDGLTLQYDLSTVPKTFQIQPGGVSWTDGVLNFSTGLGRLAALQDALQAIELPPNAYTLKVNDTILFSDGVSSLVIDNNQITHNNAVPTDLAISSNQNITVSADNIDIGTTEIIYPSLATANRLRLKASGQYLADNNGGGTATANCATVLNQVSATGGILTEEVYNQRTATNGSFNQKSFYAKNSGGGKTEYARISAVAENISSNRGQLDLAVAGSGGTISTYLSLSGNNGHINANRNIDMNNNNITSCATIETDITNYYGKQITPVFLTAHSTISNNVEPYVRFNAWNAGRSPTWEQASISDFTGSVENVSASWYSFNSYWWVGTTAGNVYYSNDGGNSWTLFYSFGGRINCFQTYNSNSFLAIGGAFTGTYNYLAVVDTAMNIQDYTGVGGLNGDVYCFFEDTTHFILHIGGAFSAFYGSSGVAYGFYAFDWNTNGFNTLNSYTGGGFLGGAVKSITYDTTNSFVIVGGDFTSEDTGSGSIGIPYLFTFTTSNGYSVSGYFSAGFSPNSNVSSVLSYTSGGIIVGGQFTNSSGVGSCNTNYGFKMTWTGSNWDLTDYPIYSPQNPISSIIYNATTGIYYTTENGSVIFSGATQLPALPTGSVWECIAYNGSSTYFSTNNQTSVGFIFYLLNNSLAINLGIGSYSIRAYSGTYTNCVLLGFGSNVELMYYNGYWWVVSQNGCNFS